jgi:hypothetical protein
VSAGSDDSDDSGDSGGLGVPDGAEVSGAKGGKKGQDWPSEMVYKSMGCGPEGSGRLDIQFFFRLFAHLLDVSIFINDRPRLFVDTVLYDFFRILTGGSIPLIECVPMDRWPMVRQGFDDRLSMVSQK